MTFILHDNFLSRHVKLPCHPKGQKFKLLRNEEPFRSESSKKSNTLKGKTQEDRQKEKFLESSQDHRIGWKVRYRWIVEQDLNQNLRVNFSCFFSVFTCLLDEIVFILLWLERLFPLHKYYKVKIYDVTSGTWDVGFRGKWVSTSVNVMGELGTSPCFM